MNYSWSIIGNHAKFFFYDLLAMFVFEFII